MKYMTGKSLHTVSFCLMKLPVLEYPANAKYIDYLAAFLNAAPFSSSKPTLLHLDSVIYIWHNSHYHNQLHYNDFVYTALHFYLAMAHAAH